MTTEVEQNMILMFERNLVSLNSVEELSVESIRQSLNRDGFACIRGLIHETEVIIARQHLRAQFSKANDHPSVGEKPREIKSNFQKLRVGSSPAYPSDTRLARNIHNPLWEEDIYAMHNIFRKLIALRNKLLGKAKDYASDHIEDGVWTAARIQQYPSGGGFMSPHRDVTEGAKSVGLKYVQLLLLMTKKGVDYERGGGFIQRNGETIMWDDFGELGDIIVYDGSTIHGVQDIDPHKPLDLDTFTGRIVAVCPLYKDLGDVDKWNAPKER